MALSNFKIEQLLPGIPNGGSLGSSVTTFDLTGCTNVLLPAGTTINGSSLTALGTITSTSANALAVGRQGTTHPAFNVDASAGTQLDGLNVAGLGAGNGAAVSVITSGTNSPLTIDAAGSGTITLGSVSTGNVIVSATLAPAANVGITATSGTGAFDFSAASGTFKTSTGTNTIGGATVFAANKGVTVSAGTSAFDFSGGSGIFKTSTGAVTIGAGNVSISGAVTMAANIGIATTSGTGAFDFSNGSGVFKTTTGVSTFGGSVNNFTNAIIANHATAAINSTNTATAAQVATGYITSTSAAGTTITLPTGTLLGTQLGATQGTIHDLYIDNTAGANTVTIAVAVNGILSAAAVANGASQGLLTVPSGITGQACFRLMFSSSSAYTFTRIA